MARLKGKQRRKLPASAFAYPSTRSYPIHDKAHARAALARSASRKTGGSYAHVAAAVNRRFPGLAKGQTKTRSKSRARAGRHKASGRKR